MAASYQQTYNINAGMQAICDTIRSKGFADKLNTEIKAENPTQTGVWYRIHHGASFTSWGEKITITLTPLSESATQVNIHSECGMPTQVVDWGKNKQVVCNIYEYIEANVAHNFTPQNNVQASASFCPMCGKPVALNNNFCTGCGTRIK